MADCHGPFEWERAIAAWACNRQIPDRGQGREGGSLNDNQRRICHELHIIPSHDCGCIASEQRIPKRRAIQGIAWSVPGFESDGISARCLGRAPVDPVGQLPGPPSHANLQMIARGNHHLFLRISSNGSRQSHPRSPNSTTWRQNEVVVAESYRRVDRRSGRDRRYTEEPHALAHETLLTSTRRTG